MKRIMMFMLGATLLPVSATAQEDPTQRLSEVLPPDVVAQVLEQIENARSRELPSQAMANLALEGVAKGRSATEVLAAVESLAGDMGRAMDALQAAGHDPVEGEVEAATAAMRMGVDGEEISALARSQPSGRTLAVPMLVIGGLTERGLPSDEALVRVAARLAEQADDAALLGDFPEVGQGFAQGMIPGQVGPALAGGLAGFQVPVAGINVPVGPPSDIGGRPSNPGPPTGLPVGIPPIG